jgi:uncharacterized Zn finger protein (UPF0148 family)
VTAPTVLPRPSNSALRRGSRVERLLSEQEVTLPGQCAGCGRRLIELDGRLVCPNPVCGGHRPDLMAASGEAAASASPPARSSSGRRRADALRESRRQDATADVEGGQR